MYKMLCGFSAIGRVVDLAPYQLAEWLSALEWTLWSDLVSDDLGNRRTGRGENHPAAADLNPLLGVRGEGEGNALGKVLLEPLDRFEARAELCVE